MTALTTPLSRQFGAPLTRMLRDAPLFTLTALGLCATMIPTLVAMAVDTRQVQFESPWIKPLKFQVALAIYLVTLAIYTRWLPKGMTVTYGYRLFAGSVVTAIILESLWINGAAAFATASHFNQTSALMGTIYRLMGAAALLLTSASLVFGIAIWRNRASSLSRAQRTALGLGLVLTFFLTVVVAGYMANLSGHLVGTPTTHSGVPIMGWSTEVGDLRVSHFLATHALHVIPLAALILGASVRTVWAIAFTFCLIVIAAFYQALLGMPLVSL